MKRKTARKRGPVVFFARSTGKKAPGSSSLRREIYGLLCLSTGILLVLAVASYHPSDPIGQLTAENAFRVQNWLGLVGATVAHYLFQWTFGFPAVIWGGLLMLAGVGFMRHVSPGRLVKLSLLLLGWAFLASLLLALPKAWHTFGQTTNYYPSGLLGGLVANLLIQFTGKLATVFLSVVFFLILAIATFHLRVSTLFNRLVTGLWLAFTGVLAGLRRAFFAISQRASFTRRSPARTARRRVGPGKPGVPEMDSKAAVRKPLQPSPEEEVEAAPEVEAPPIEVVTHKDPIEELQKAPTVEPGTEKPRPEEVANEMEKVQITSPGGADLEIEEAVQEKELDYDTLVRNSLARYQFPSTDLLNDDPEPPRVSREELIENAALLERTLEKFNVKAKVKRVVEGPVITLYAVRPAEGVKINQIVSLADDLALAMRAKAIRMIAPIPGEAAIGIEIPNRTPSTVYFSSIVRSEKFINAEGQLVLGMGKTISGEVFCADLTKMPHLLIAGATGAGKSVGINTIIASLLYRVPPSEVKFVLIDPKKLELSPYALLKDHYLAICPELDEAVITHPQNAILVLRSLVNEMEQRYDKLAHLGVRDIVSYNQKIEKYAARGETSDEYRKLPYLVVIIDELADLILTAAREVEEPITRLAQMARAVGIHLIVATQRPSVDILTGLIKANFPTRIAYQVATRPDSKVILDMYGAEKLIGKGDMLFLPPGTGKPIRLQNALITTEEVGRIIRHVRKQPKFPPYELKLVWNRPAASAKAMRESEQDELFEKAKEIVIRHQQGSISLLQRKLKIGYARAARLIDELEEAGVVGPGQGSKARDVLISSYGDEA
ncbi:MAG: DNA translocase FtsK [Calditrichaeota bacterium]|nr:MAG: DNA translocase FtsK [Calditrichota bacterium]